MHNILLQNCVGSCLQELRQRIRDSYEARWKAEKHFDEDQILNEMPGSLRIEVSYTVLNSPRAHPGDTKLYTLPVLHASFQELLAGLHADCNSCS